LEIIFWILYNKLNNIKNINEIIINPVNKLIIYFKKGEYYYTLNEKYQLIKYENNIVKNYTLKIKQIKRKK